MGAADALVLCSDGEPLGRCLIEGMAMELPVVVTDSGGGHELFRDRINGLITPGGNAGELAARMIEVLTDRDISDRLARSAREYAESELGIELHAKKVTQVYEEVIAGSLSAKVCHQSRSVLPHMMMFGSG